MDNQKDLQKLYSALKEFEKRISEMIEMHKFTKKVLLEYVLKYNSLKPKFKKGQNLNIDVSKYLMKEHKLYKKCTIIDFYINESFQVDTPLSISYELKINDIPREVAIYINEEDLIAKTKK